MAEPQTVKWNKATLWLSDGASPPTFVNPCGLTQKEFALTKAMAESVIPDCDDPDAVPWTGRDVRSKSLQISASGILAGEAYPDYRDWWDTDESRLVRWRKIGTGLGYWEGKAHLSEFRETGNEGDGKMQVSLTIVSDGEWTWHAAT